MELAFTWQKWYNKAVEMNNTMIYYCVLDGSTILDGTYPCHPNPNFAVQKYFVRFATQIYTYDT